jgi:hypothetical protein
MHWMAQKERGLGLGQDLLVGYGIRDSVVPNQRSADRGDSDRPAA